VKKTTAQLLRIMFLLLAGALFIGGAALVVGGCEAPHSSEDNLSNQTQAGKGDAPRLLSQQSVSDYVLTATGGSATVRFTSSKDGAYFVVALPSETEPPAGGAILEASFDAAGVKATGAVEADAAVTVSITGMTRDKPYRVYAVIKDKANNYSEVWASDSFTPSQDSFAQSRDMASIPAVRASFPGGGSLNLSAFQIAKYETTYELWYTVKTWATARGYTFANKGREGADGHSGNYGSPLLDGTSPSDDRLEPVTCVSWRDAIVWCNAYSEWVGKVPVYTYGGVTLRDSTNVTACDSVQVNASSGYRLPGVNEWMAAALGGNPGDTTAWNYTYAGSNNIGDVAWYYGNLTGARTARVGMKNPNSAGLYDMSGNVAEWCWDTLGASRCWKGGSWQSAAGLCATAYSDGKEPGYTGASTGFRVACTP
jgi:hypothetical protein